MTDLENKIDCLDFDDDCFDMSEEHIRYCKDYQPERGRCFFCKINSKAITQSNAFTITLRKE
jgi:hypothetical protein